MLWSSKQQAIGGMSSEKNVPWCSPKICAGLIPNAPPSAIWMQIWKVFLVQSEQGNLTSCLELSNAFEISKYSIPANSTWNSSGIILLSSPGHCPYCAIICRCDLLLLSQTDNCLKDAECSQHPHGPHSPETEGRSSLTGLTPNEENVCNSERVTRLRETKACSEPSTRQSERTTFAIFLRFVRIGMTQSGEGNGCENGKWSHKNGGLHHFLYFHACGSHSVIQGDVQGKVLFWPFLAPGPPPCTVPRAAFCIPVLSNCAPWGVHPALQHPDRPAANALEMLLET